MHLSFFTTLIKTKAADYIHKLTKFNYNYFSVYVSFIIFHASLFIYRTIFITRLCVTLHHIITVSKIMNITYINSVHPSTFFERTLNNTHIVFKKILKNKHNRMDKDITPDILFLTCMTRYKSQISFQRFITTYNYRLKDSCHHCRESNIGKSINIGRSIVIPFHFNYEINVH